MADLLAQGPTAGDRWRRTLPDGTLTLGRRSPPSAWDVPWDRQVSSVHAALTWRDDRLLVRRSPHARNPVFFRGEALGEFDVPPGETFVIGETTFTRVDGGPTVDVGAAFELPQPDVEMTCSRAELHRARYVDPEERIEALAALPELIRVSAGDAELEARVLDVLLGGIARAGAAQIVRLRPAGAAGAATVEVRAARARGRGVAVPRPSRRLVLDALAGRRQGVVYRWDAGGPWPDFTADTACDWALCVPLPADPAPGWGLYVSGRLGGATGPDVAARLKGDLKFAEVVADVFGSLRQVRDLQRRQTQLTGFLPRPVVTALAGRDIDAVLRPRPAEVTVLFCDLRGSCRVIDEGRDDLPGLWNRVGAALHTMTASILEEDGVVADFLGDAALGFWGWPLEVPDQVERAARAAQAIRRRFAEAGGFACGIGIAHGPAFAGKLGTPDLFKVGVFGPVVNLAARLESLTKRFRVPILLDEASAARLGRERCRRVARVRPRGLRTAVLVSELLPPGERDGHDYEAGLDAFLAGRWQEAAELLRRSPQDGAAGHLRAFMEQRGGRAPADWDGVIALDEK